MAYKNLGPMVASRDEYIKDMADKNFSYRNTCKIISKEEAQEHLVEATNAF